MVLCLLPAESVTGQIAATSRTTHRVETGPSHTSSILIPLSSSAVDSLTSQLKRAPATNRGSPYFGDSLQGAKICLNISPPRNSHSSSICGGPGKFNAV